MSPDAETVLDGSKRSVLTVVAGIAGIGRTTLLDQTRALARQRGATTVSLRLSTLDATLPFYLGSRLAIELGGVATGVSPGAGSAGAAAAGVAKTILRSMMDHADLVVLVDDAQWMDAHSMLAVEMVVRELSTSTKRFVFGVRTPLEAGRLSGGPRTFARLRADGLARLVNLRPLAAGQIMAALAVRTRARPHRDLSARVSRVSRGVPAALDAAADSYRRSGTLRVVGHQAYLSTPTGPVDLANDHSLVTRVRALGFPTWEVAKAVAVLHPLGDAVARLAGDALDLDAIDVASALATLVDAGVLRRHRNGDWRFTVPLLVDALTAGLGPFERRQLAQAAVHASWDGTVVAEPGYLADRIVDAGRFVDSDRASAELLRIGVAALFVDAPAAVRWLSTAADLTQDRTVRARALLAQAVACRVAGDHARARGNAELVLDSYQGDLTPDESLDAQLVYVLSLGGLRDEATLADVAGGGQDGAGPVARAVALTLLGRFAQARASLAGSRATWSTHDAAADCAATVEAIAAALSGRPRLLNPSAGWRSEPSPYLRRELIAGQVRVLAFLGDLPQIHRRLADQRMSTAELPATDQLLVAWRAGQWAEVMDRAPLTIAETDRSGPDGDSGLIYQLVASIQLAQGRPATARATIEAGRAAGAPMGHLLDLAEARIDRTLGADDDCRRRVSDGLAAAERSAIVPGTDELWLLYALLAANRGDGEEAARGVAETASVARQLGTSYAAHQHLLARVVVEHDPDAAAEATTVARTLDQPFLLARTLETVVRAEAGSPELLREAYDIFGELDALLHRCWVRTLMRGYGVAVPDRGATVAENERLLATLVGEGASNRQIATILHTSENGVEGKLSRLFARTGYRSRVELATAVLSGEYHLR